MHTDRYEILDTIAQGKFATVSRARDLELGREVAVKQIHAQYLAEPRQLAKFWPEVELLALLQHPNILTIHGVVRSHGWLALELMPTSLKPAAEGDPLDFDQLRAVLINCLHGLAFLHSHKIIHGDIKPSNILLDPQGLGSPLRKGRLAGRVKLGDFGLARRASNQEGRLVDGTTKYMAPELLSAQFGRVGRACDLYSLGITAYELMVGRHFESLLPALSSFGHDKQHAWTMWHSTADLKLPDVHRAREGVPDDLAHVIQRLIAKDQPERYASAREALWELQSGRAADDGLLAAAVAEAEAAATQIARKKRRTRILAILCGWAVMALSAWFMFLLFTTPPKLKMVRAAESIHGTISDVYPVSHELGVSSAGRGELTRIVVGDQDIIYVNGQKHVLEVLERGDVVDIANSIDTSSLRDVREIHVTRPGRFAAGLLVSRDENLRTIEMMPGQASDQTELLRIFVPTDLPIALNGAATFQDRPVTIASLAPGDRLNATYDYRGASGNLATKLEALRQVDLKGVLAADFDVRTRLLSVVDEKQRIVTLPFASDYKIFVNHEPVAAPCDLKRGDRVTIKHDTYIVEVIAQRTLGTGGVVQRVRLTEAAKKLLRNMADRAAGTTIDPDEFESEYQQALRLAGSEPEPRLIYGLLLLKRTGSEGREKAIEHFQSVKSEMPGRLLPCAALAWLRLQGDRDAFSAGINELTAMLGLIPASTGPESPYSSEARFLFEWSGQLSEYAAATGGPSRQLDESVAALDAAIAAHGPLASDLYAKGRQAFAAALADRDGRIAAAKDEVEVGRLKIDRGQLRACAAFPLNQYVKQLRQQLEK